MQLSLDGLEHRLQTLLEVQLLNLFPGRKLEDVIAQQLAAAIKERIDPETKTVPGQYIIRVNPAISQTWQKDPDILASLTGVMRTVASELQLTFATPINLILESDETLGEQDVQITAAHNLPLLAETRALNTSQGTDDPEEDFPRNAFFIIDGERIFQLKTRTINVGRRSDNDLVLEDPRVSRYHAQIRVVKSRFVILDLNSTGGTFVNGRRTNQSILYPGDVISLAGIKMIYGQDNLPTNFRSGDTEPIHPAASSRSTAILKPLSEFDPKK
jgi:hypothetical protein